MSKRARFARAAGRQGTISPGAPPTAPQAPIVAPGGAGGLRSGPREARWLTPGSPEEKEALEAIALQVNHGLPAANDFQERSPRSGVPLYLRAAALRVPLAQVLAALSQIEAELQGKISQVDLSDHPNAAKLFASLAEAKKDYSRWYHHVGVALACVAPGSEAGQ
jgi:hypothetical protein